MPEPCSALSREAVAGQARDENQPIQAEDQLSLEASLVIRVPLQLDDLRLSQVLGNRQDPREKRSRKDAKAQRSKQTRAPKIFAPLRLCAIFFSLRLPLGLEQRSGD
jgi:hypothetical protein